MTDDMCCQMLTHFKVALIPPLANTRTPFLDSEIHKPSNKLRSLGGLLRGGHQAPAALHKSVTYSLVSTNGTGTLLSA